MFKRIFAVVSLIATLVFSCALVLAQSKVVEGSDSIAVKSRSRTSFIFGVPNGSGTVVFLNATGQPILQRFMNATSAVSRQKSSDLEIGAKSSEPKGGGIIIQDDQGNPFLPPKKRKSTNDQIPTK